MAEVLPQGLSSSYIYGGARQHDVSTGREGSFPSCAERIALPEPAEALGSEKKSLFFTASVFGNPAPECGVHNAH